MKTYEKPGISVVQLLQDERISAACPVRWNWIVGSGPNQKEVDEYYLLYFGGENGTMGWTCLFDVETNLGVS